MLQQVQREDGVTEFFISERFIQSEEWKTILSKPREISGYNYTKDYVKYNQTPLGQELVHRLKFSEIIHATHPSALMSIIKDDGLKPGQKSIPDCTLDSFVWFGMKIGQPEVDALKDYFTWLCKTKMQDISAAIDCRSIVNSPCFEPMSRYGKFKLAFEIQNVIKAYSQQFCHKIQETSDCPKPDFRILGTFVYEMEIMHTVLVCPPDTPGTSKYPLLSQSQTPVIWEDEEKEGTFVWSPDSTGDKDKASEISKEREPSRRWEHVTFAFYVPAGKILKLNITSDNISVGIYLDQYQKLKPSSIKDTINQFLDEVREFKEINKKRYLVNLLIRLIRGYLDEEKVFEKMNILYMYQPIDLDTVVDRVDKLLDGKEFNWSPLIEWMKDVQQTKNKTVLVSIFQYLQKKENICVAKLAQMALQNT